jgi:hypothetical protein
LPSSGMSLLAPQVEMANIYAETRWMWKDFNIRCKGF